MKKIWKKPMYTSWGSVALSHRIRAAAYSGEWVCVTWNFR